MFIISLELTIISLHIPQCAHIIITSHHREKFYYILHNKFLNNGKYYTLAPSTNKKNLRGQSSIFCLAILVNILYNMGIKGILKNYGGNRPLVYMWLPHVVCNTHVCNKHCPNSLSQKPCSLSSTSDSNVK